MVQAPLGFTDNWAIRNVILTGPGALANVPPAMSALSPPDALATVFSLPGLGAIQFSGTIAPNERLQIFTVPVPVQISTIHVQISVPETATATAERLWLLDGTGEVLGHWPIPGPGGNLSVTLDVNGPGANAGLIVGISRDDLGDQASPPFAGDYDLGIDRLPKTTMAPAFDVMPQPSSSSQSEFALPYTTSASPLGVGPSASGPLPSRSSGPSAGVLADGALVPQVARNDGLVIDLTLIDLYGAGTLEGPEVQSPAPFEAMRSAGGFPLLAAVRPPEMPAADDVTLLVSTVRLVRKPTPPAESPASSVVEESPSNRRRPVLGVGFTMAAALTFGLLLPDLVARFTPASPRRVLPSWRRKLRA